MKKQLISFALICLFFTACQEKKSTETGTETAVIQPDMVAIKAEIQALENEYAAASNARNAAGIAAIYSDDAITLESNKPMVVGKAAILKNAEEFLSKRPKGSTTEFETLEVFGNDKLVTEIGKSVNKDAAGKVIYTGKYMALWEKRDGKWLTIRDINNDDKKEK